MSMFKPDNLLDTLNTHGYMDTLRIVLKKLRRMGKSKDVADKMAWEIMSSICKYEFEMKLKEWDSIETA